MPKIIRVAIEENSKGTLLHLVDMPGAYTRAKKLKDALSKIIDEVKSYENWLDIVSYEIEDYEIDIVQRENTNAMLDDGDTEILTLREKEMDLQYFNHLKYLTLKSAYDFKKLYDSIPDKEFDDVTKNRTTFYGKVPSNAKEMLFHVDEVKTYYLSRINIIFPKDESNFILNRIKSIELIENDKNSCLNNTFFINNEHWNTAKVLRRFIWHDRIHARALYRFAVRQWGYDKICNPFKFNVITDYNHK